MLGSVLAISACLRSVAICWSRLVARARSTKTCCLRLVDDSSWYSCSALTRQVDPFKVDWLITQLAVSGVLVRRPHLHTYAYLTR